MSKKDRRLACKLAAQLLSDKEDTPLMPRLWSTVVFFESYIERGAKGTMNDFGPKKPVKLKTVREPRK